MFYKAKAKQQNIREKEKEWLDNSKLCVRANMAITND